VFICPWASISWLCPSLVTGHICFHSDNNRRGFVREAFFSRRSAVGTTANSGAPPRCAELVTPPSPELACLSDRMSASISPELHVLSIGLRGSVLLWRRCDTLCTSGFMDERHVCISSSSSSSFYLPSNTTVCTSTSIQFRRAGQQGPTRTLTAALKRVIEQLLGTYSFYRMTARIGDAKGVYTPP